MTFDLQELAVLVIALEQFIDNQPEWQAEGAEVATARALMNTLEVARLKLLDAHWPR